MSPDCQASVHFNTSCVSEVSCTVAFLSLWQLPDLSVWRMSPLLRTWKTSSFLTDGICWLQSHPFGNFLGNPRFPWWVHRLESSGSSCMVEGGTWLSPEPPVMEREWSNVDVTPASSFKCTGLSVSLVQRLCYNTAVQAAERGADMLCDLPCPHALAVCMLEPEQEFSLGSFRKLLTWFCPSSPMQMEVTESLSGLSLCLLGAS